jgi:hypothetical protein
LALVQSSLRQLPLKNQGRHHSMMCDLPRRKSTAAPA